MVVVLIVVVDGTLHVASALPLATCAHLVAESAVEHEAEVEAFVGKGVGHTQYPVWIGVSYHYAVVVRVDAVVAVLVDGANHTCRELVAVFIELGHELSIFWLPDAAKLIIVQRVDGLTDEEVVVDIVFLAIGELVDLVFLIRNIERCGPAEVLVGDVDCVEGNVDTLVGSLTDVCPCVFVAIDRWNAHLHEQVFGL